MGRFHHNHWFSAFFLRIIASLGSSLLSLTFFASTISTSVSSYL